MYSQIIQFLEYKKLIYYKQFGFRKNFATAYAIINLIERLQSAFDNNKFVFRVFTDFEKAFDTVDHNILLNKINYCKIRSIAIDCFKSCVIDTNLFQLMDLTLIINL